MGSSDNKLRSFEIWSPQQDGAYARETPLWVSFNAFSAFLIDVISTLGTFSVLRASRVPRLRALHFTCIGVNRETSVTR